MARIKDINNIPLPAWDLFPVDNYLRYEFGSGVNRGRSLPMLSIEDVHFSAHFAPLQRCGQQDTMLETHNLLLMKLNIIKKDTI